MSTSTKDLDIHGDVDIAAPVAPRRSVEVPIDE